MRGNGVLEDDADAIDLDDLDEDTGYDPDEDEDEFEDDDDLEDDDDFEDDDDLEYPEPDED